MTRRDEIALHIFESVTRKHTMISISDIAAKLEVAHDLADEFMKQSDSYEIRKRGGKPLPDKYVDPETKAYDQATHGE